MKNKFSSIAIIALSAIAVLGVGGTAAMLLSKNGTTKTFVQETDAQIAKKKIYSVTFDGEHSQGVRGDDAVGLTAGTNGDLNDFDNCYPWNTMRDVTVGTDKYVNIDAFYFKIEELDDGMKFSISGYPYRGYMRSTAHYQGNKEFDSILIGKYEASFANDNADLASVSGANVAASITLASAREKAANKGNHLYEWRQHQMIQLLYAVEFADLNSQNIFVGHTNSDHLIQTGGTDAMRGSSRGSSTEDSAMAYRGIENWYGNTWTWIDGICTTKVGGENKIGVSLDWANNDDVDTYRIYDTSAIIDNVTANGLFIFNLSSLTGDTCYLQYPDEGYYIGVFGGGYDGGSNAGAFYVNVSGSPSGSNGHHGFRLSRLPSQA